MTHFAADTRSRAIAYARSLLQQSPLYMDTETTGLSRDSEIVEISIIDDDGQVVFESLIRPQNPIPAAVTALHGITDQMVATAPPFGLVWPQIRGVLYGRQVGIYNSNFDLGIIEGELKRLNLRPVTINAFCILDLYSEFRAEWDPVRRRLRRFSLESAGRYFQIPLPNAHRARADALLARAVLHCIAGARE